MTATDKKVWLITGAGRGLGVEIAKAVLASGHSLVATGRDAAKVAAAIGDHDNMLAVKLDVTAFKKPTLQSRPPSQGSVGSTSSSTTLGMSSPVSSRSSARNRCAIRSTL